MWYAWLCNSSNIIWSILFCTKSEIKTEPDPLACSPSHGAWQQQQTAGCRAVTGEDRQQGGLGEMTGRKNSNLPLSSPPTELCGSLFPCGAQGMIRVTASWVKGSSAELPLMLQKTSWLLGPSAAALADATNLISVSVFCWGLQHKPCKVTEEWQFKKVYIWAK